MKIVAIGGGEIGRPGHPIETEAIDREIVRLTGKKRPKALLLPTASGDNPLYATTFRSYYGQRLQCRTEVLHLVAPANTATEIRRRILGADIIYVGGGNALRMMKIWRRRGVDEWLRQAARNGTVLAGVSAGAICWFQHGISCAKRFGPNKSSTFIRLRGIGLLPLMACPHYNVDTSRRLWLGAMIRRRGGIAIALDNCAALEVVDDRYRVLTSSESARVYRLYRRHGRVIEESLAAHRHFRPLAELLADARVMEFTARACERKM